MVASGIISLCGLRWQRAVVSGRGMGVEDDCKLKAGHKVDGRWQVVRKLGEGAFGAVYEAFDVQGKVKGSKALKLESVRCRDQVLKIEVAVLQAMAGTQHVCRLYCMGRNDTFNFMLMSLLGPSLSVLRKRQKDCRFTVSVSTYVSIQCLQAIRDMHLCGWLHRDVKPSNFAIGNQQEEGRRSIFLFDFGLSRNYKNPDGSLRPPRPKAGFRGTVRYCSVNGHKGLELGRHDDLISILYMMVEMVKGSLPWKSLDRSKEVGAVKEEKAKEIYELMPPRLLAVHEYLHTLKYEDKPNYGMFEEVLRQVTAGKGYEEPAEDEWQLIKHGKITEEKDIGATSEIVNRGFTSEKDNDNNVEELPKSQYREMIRNQKPED